MRKRLAVDAVATGVLVAIGVGFGLPVLTSVGLGALMLYLRCCALLSHRVSS